MGRLEISGYYGQLSRGFQDLGIRHDYITYWSNPFGFGGETVDPLFLRWARHWPTFSASAEHRLAFRLVSAVIREVLVTVWAVRALLRYDAFILGFGETLLRGNLDLRLIKLLRKPVIVNMAHGSEARPPYIDGSALQVAQAAGTSPREMARKARRLASRVRRIERLATYVIGAPYSTSQFSTRPFINHFSIGIPYDRDENPPTPAGDAADRPIVVLHSPSNPSIKGTALIMDAINLLISQGYKIDFRVIAGRPNHEVIDAIVASDFVVDQVFSDTPLAGFATEAAWAGRCSVVGGYALTDLTTRISPDMMPPSMQCRPADIVSAIAHLIDNPQERQLLARRAQEFVLNKWSPREVARRYLRLLHDDVPRDWWVDPKSISYCYGMGLHASDARRAVEAILESEGVAGLALPRKSLREAFLSFSSG